MTAIAAFRAVCHGCLEHMEANREGMLRAADPEYLHQMRVALRRLRSAFSVFSRLLPQAATRPPLAEIEWLQDALGTARDWDVFLQENVAPLRARHPANAGLRALEAGCARRRSAARGAARRAVGSARCARLAGDLRAWLADESWTSLLELEDARALRRPVAEYAQNALERRDRQVRRRGRRIERRDPAELHRLRLAVKKLRYTVEFFAPLYAAPRVTRLLRPLKAMQDVLGSVSDCDAAERLLARLRPATSSAASTAARRLVAARNDAALTGHRRRLRPAWKALRAARRFWKH